MQGFLPQTHGYPLKHRGCQLAMDQREMSDQYNVVLGASKKLETLLASIGSEGRGLHEKCRSVEHLLPPDIVWSIRMVATIRNKLLHENGYELRDIGDFLHQAGSAIDYLEKASKPEPAEPKRKGLKISSPDRIINEIAIAEMEWFSKQPILFPSPAKDAINPDPDD